MLAVGAAADGEPEPEPTAPAPTPTAADDAAAPPAGLQPKGTVLFLHGNAQNISAHIAAVHWLPKAGYNLLLLDYRGYGE